MKLSTTIAVIIGLHVNNVYQCEGSLQKTAIPADSYVDVEKILGDLFNRPMKTPSINENQNTEMIANNTTIQRSLDCNSPSCGAYLEEKITKHGLKAFCIYSDEPVAFGTLDKSVTEAGEGSSRTNLFGASGGSVGYVQTTCQETNIVDEAICVFVMKFLNTAGYEIGSMYLQGAVFTGDVMPFTQTFSVTGGSGCFAGAVGSVFIETDVVSGNYNLANYDAAWKFTLYEYWKHEYYWQLQ